MAKTARRKRSVRLKLDGEKWMMAPHVGVKLVDELVMLNIHFRYVVVYKPNAAREEWVEVDEQVGKAVRLFMDNGGFAGLPLADFIRKVGSSG